MVKVTYQNGEDYSLTIDKVLNTDKLYLLEQLCDFAHSNDATSRIVVIFKERMLDMLNEIMELYANDLDDDDDESKESDEQRDGYI
ncbi:hypothetical protein Hanom_Chr00s108461g01806681 [Helianthus anomalus]